MKGLSWLPWIVDDWLTSPTRLSMTLAERAILQDLLAYQWKDESIPSDHEQLAIRAAVPLEVFESAAPQVLRKFRLKDGRYRNAKLAVLRKSALKRLSAQERKAQQGGIAKASKIREMRATSTHQAEQTLSSYIGVCSSSEVLETSEEQKKPPTRAREISAAPQTKNGANGNGYDPQTGWEWFRQVYPNIPNMDLACQMWLSRVLDQQTENAIRSALGQPAPWFTSRGWIEGKIHNADNWLQGRMWLGRPAQAHSRGEQRSLENKIALDRAFQRKFGGQP